MVMLKRRMLLACLLQVGLISCSTTQQATNEAAVTKAVATKTLVAPTAIDISPIQNGMSQCVNASQPLAMAANLNIPGAIGIESNGSVFALGGSSNQEHLIVKVPSVAWPIGMSLNGKWFAYANFPSSNGIPSSIHLISADRQMVSTTITPPPIVLSPPTQNGGWIFAKWVNDEVLQVTLYNGTDQDPKRVLQAVFDPFTGSWRQSEIAQLIDRDDQGGLSLSPDMTRALYIANKDGKYSLVLWDLTEHQELWRQSNFGNLATIKGARIGNVPIAWSRDSTKIGFVDWVSGPNVLEGKIYILDRNGKQQKLLASSQEDNKAYGLSWSPDGRYLGVIEGLTTDSTESAILIYDAVTYREMAVCSIEKESNPVNSVQTGALVWSPDGHYLAYGLGADPLEPNNAIVILNLYTGELTLIKKGPRVTLLNWSETTDWLQP
jgi:hypothetical protein